MDRRQRSIYSHDIVEGCMLKFRERTLKKVATGTSDTLAIEQYREI